MISFVYSFCEIYIIFFEKYLEFCSLFTSSKIKTSRQFSQEMIGMFVLQIFILPSPKVFGVPRTFFQKGSWRGMGQSPMSARRGVGQRPIKSTGNSFRSSPQFLIHSAHAAGGCCRFGFGLAYNQCLCCENRGRNGRRVLESAS